MKLYTEEKLRASMLSMITYIKMYDESVIDKIVENHIKALGGVKLPSDEEIDEASYIERYQIAFNPFASGAKYLKDKIQGSNNDN